MPKAVRTLADGAGEVDVSGSVSETVPLEQINDALRRLAERKGDPVRVVVRPTE